MPGSASSPMPATRSVTSTAASGTAAGAGRRRRVRRLLGERVDGDSGGGDGGEACERVADRAAGGFGAMGQR